MDQEWDFSIHMTDHKGSSGPSRWNVIQLSCKHVTGSQGITYHGNEKRVLIGNEVELGMQRYRRSKPQISRLSRDKGKLVSYVSGSFDRKVIVEIFGSHMNFQIPLLVIDWISVSIMSA